VASVRAEIKSRAFKSSTAPRRYRRRASVNNRRQTADDKENTTAEHSEPPTAQPSSTGTGRCSLSAPLQLTVSNSDREKAVLLFALCSLTQLST